MFDNIVGIMYTFFMNKDDEVIDHSRKELLIYTLILCAFESYAFMTSVILR